MMTMKKNNHCRHHRHGQRKVVFAQSQSLVFRDQCNEMLAKHMAISFS